MNEFQNAGYGYGDPQFAPQGFLGGLLGAPLGGLIGRGVGSLFGNARLGNQIGQFAGGIGGSLLPFGVDPVQQAQQQMMQQQIQQQQLQELQQAQLAQQLNPQGWFGNLIGQVGRPLGGAIGGIFGNSGVGSTIGGIAGSLGKLLPFGVDPSMMAHPQVLAQIQQQQLFQQIQQLQQQLQQQQQQYAQLAQAIAQQQQQQQGQQGQIAPQGWFGNLIGQVGQPLGGAIGGLFGNSQLGSNIGNVAGQIGRMLPFGADPVAQAYAQQQMAQAQLQGNSYYPVQGMQYAQQPTLH
ncbi:MAG: hypothetical protein V4631_12120 [Pseudomonadota bacterium]